MVVSNDEIEYIANLAKLRLTAADIEKMQTELSAILRYISMLDDVDCDYFNNEIEQFRRKCDLRDDLELSSLAKGEVLKNGPSVHGGMFSVPKVI